ncbi:uncharacterized protein PHA67_000771 isoform 2-T2 [Liasis olivaceus]
MQIKQLLEKSFPNKLDINGAGYVDSNEKVKAICDGIKRHLRSKASKNSKSGVTGKESPSREEQGQPSQKPERKPTVEGPLAPGAEKKPETTTSTEKSNDFTTTTRRT